MDFIKRFYAAFGRFELYLVAAILLAISTLMFVSALARTIGHPLNWAVDISMLLFAWMVFVGGDIVIRETNLISVDMFLNKMPRWLRTTLLFLFYILMLAFLVVLVRYGVPLLMRNWKRVFQSTGISYSWCTMAVPVGSFLMFVSTSVRMVQRVFMANKTEANTPAVPEEVL
ncbi:MAG: TRAP transporter small permease subunit [Planctomycetaceae bacterium]|nr:TRAP transporter small permease subunit [Planctomycetaceae bacterium]